jgi:hypothetical protein
MGVVRISPAFSFLTAITEGGEESSMRLGVTKQNSTTYSETMGYIYRFSMIIFLRSLILPERNKNSFERYT